MSDSPLRKRKILVTCPKCKGYKGIYGKSALGHPATLPCPQCDACGEVDQSTLPFELLAKIVDLGKGDPMVICVCDLGEESCPEHPKEK